MCSFIWNNSTATSPHSTVALRSRSRLTRDVRARAALEDRRPYRIIIRGRPRPRHVSQGRSRRSARARSGFTFRLAGPCLLQMWLVADSQPVSVSFCAIRARVMLSLATADCAWLVLTTAVPSGARDSRLRVNHCQNRRAGDEREGKCSTNDEPFHAMYPSQAQPASLVR
jgi:hypothetical protein